MNVYIDLTLLPGGDIDRHFLWEKLFQQVHLALVENKDADGHSAVSISFPEFNAEKNQLGRKLRLFAANTQTMEQLAIGRWLERLTDYVHITSIRPVPETPKGYACFYRVAVQSSRERLARRAAKRSAGSFEQAMLERQGFQPKYTCAPYIWLNSLSKKQRFRLFIGMEAVDKKNDCGRAVYSCYGLSRQGCLPLF